GSIQALDQSQLHRVRRDHDDRDRGRCLPRSTRRFGTVCNNHVDPEANQLGCKGRVTLRVTVRVTAFYGDILRLDVAQVAGPRPARIIGRPVCFRYQISDRSTLSCLLRPGGERRGKETAGKAGDERAPVHYSIPSSARPSSDCGIVKPRALAVLRLITKSNLLGCSTGRSAGFAPLRILST